jgi:uncharacterized protein YybS (DUF2232 family)
LKEPPHKDLVPAAALILVLILLVIFFPALAAGITVLAPVPLLFVYLRHGRRAGLMLLALLFGALAAFQGGGQALQFLGGDAVMAVLIAETVLMGLAFDKSILLGALGSALVSLALLLAVFSGEEGSPVDFFQKEIEKRSSESIATMKSMGESQETLDALQAYTEENSRTLASAYPVFVFFGALVSTILNYTVVRWLWRRLFGAGLFSPARFSEWIFPEQFVWGVIASGGLFFFGEGALGLVGMNVFFVLLAVYFFQGLAVAVYFLSARKVPVFIWVALLIMVLLQPLLVGLVAGVGLFDIWADFRKLRTPPAAG